MSDLFVVGNKIFTVYHSGGGRRVQGEYVVVKSGKRDVKIARVSDGYERTFNMTTGYEKGDRFGRTTLVSKEVAEQINQQQQDLTRRNTLWQQIQSAAASRDKAEVERLVSLL